MPTEMVLTPLHSVMLSTLSKVRDDLALFTRYFTKSLTAVAFMGTMASTIITLAAKDIIVFLLGNEWVMAGQIVTALGPGIAAMFVYGTHSWLHLSLATPNRWFRWNVLATISTILAFGIAAPIGAIAMAVSYTVKTYLLLIPSLWYARRPVNLEVKTIIGCIWPYFLASGFVTIFGIYIFNNWIYLNLLITGLGPLFRIFIIIAYVFFSYLITVVILHRSWAPILDILKLLKAFTSSGNGKIN
jgi:PST family polysaccharide transporter